MRIKARDLICGLVWGLGVSCTAGPQVPVTEAAQRTCASSMTNIDFDFSGASKSSCTYDPGQDIFTVKIVPEDKPINPSPWYAFRVTSDTDAIVVVDLIYTHSKHRYWPKISDDGDRWVRFTPGDVNELTPEHVRLTLKAESRPILVAAQEIFDLRQHESWVEKQIARDIVSATVIGLSKEGRDILLLDTGVTGEDGKPFILLIGRQHPPEVTGAIAMLAFSDTLLGDTVLAQRFREKFNVVMIPLINPDGVEHGYWRHNTQGTDLNRDWGPFEQPETSAVRNWMDNINDARLMLFLDFHSTRRNVFYTQTDKVGGFTVQFTQDWVQRGKARLDPNVYPFERAPRHNSELPTSKNYMHSRYMIPAITYEVGDETDRESLKIAAQVFAEEMMQILLDTQN